MFFAKKNKAEPSVLKNAFEAQSARLLKQGYPRALKIDEQQFKQKLEALWIELTSKIIDFQFEHKGTIPLLIVVGQKALPCPEQIELLGGHTNLEFEKIETTKPIDSPFYLTLDVEDGTKTIAKSPEESLRRFEKEGRSALTLEESIALLTHYPSVLKNHYLISAASLYLKENEREPLLWLLDDDDKPELHYAWFDIAHGHYGTASSATRFGI